jgi:MFS family permease
LWKNSDFLRYWFGRSVSQLGTSVSFIALPLVAVIFLHVSPFDLGLIVTAERLPPLVLGPFVGPLVDRVPRRPLMIITDLCRAILLAWIPISATLGWIAIWQLPVIGFLVAALSMVFSLASQAFLPQIVPERALTDGNGKLSASQSVADVTGPGVASWLIALGGAPLAVGADAASYVVSAWCIWRLRARDAERQPLTDDQAGRLPAFWRQTKSGFTLLWRDRVLRTLSLSNSSLVFFAQFQVAVYFYYLVHSLRLTATGIGVIFALSGVAGFFTAIGVERFAGRVGLGWVVVTGQATMVLGGVFLASAFGPPLTAAAAILLGEVLFAVGLALFGVGYSTLFQIRVPDRERGRVSGASRFVSAASLPVASLLGGLVGTIFGARMPLIVGAAGMAASVVGIMRVAAAIRVDDTISVQSAVPA